MWSGACNGLWRCPLNVLSRYRDMEREIREYNLFAPNFRCLGCTSFVWLPDRVSLEIMKVYMWLGHPMCTHLMSECVEQWADALHDWLHITESRFLIVNNGKDADLAKHIFCAPKASRDFLILSYSFVGKLKDVISSQQFKIVVCCLRCPCKLTQLRLPLCMQDITNWALKPHPLSSLNEVVGGSAKKSLRGLTDVNPKDTAVTNMAMPCRRRFGIFSERCLPAQVLDECHAIKDSKASSLTSMRSCKEAS